jgi:uncharacterized membrane protein
MLLTVLEGMGDAGIVRVLAVFGGAPMFFYILHLTTLRLLYHGALAIWGANKGTNFGFDSYGWVVLWYVC